MKLQHLSVIFVIIIMPISMVISTYVNNLIDVSNKGANYDNVLYNATYDAVRAYQMNTVNNTFASVNSSRVRDIRASVNSFFNSLATGLSSSAYSKLELNPYVPAILFTLYDGFYIYGPYENYANVDEGKLSFSTNISNIEYGLKPYIYYTCEYQDSDDYHLVVNYTLDNYISVAGTYKDAGETKYVTGSGYFIDADKVQTVNDDTKTIVLNNGITIGPEELGEFISTYDSEDSSKTTQYATLPKKTISTPISFKYYNYINAHEEKYYFDPDPDKANISYEGIPIFHLDKNLKDYLNSSAGVEAIADYIYCPELRDKIKALKKDRQDKKISETQYNDKVIGLFDFTNPDNNDFRDAFVAGYKDINNYYYYKNAQEFSDKNGDVYKALSKIDLSDSSVIKSRAYNATYNMETDGGTEVNAEHVKQDYSCKKIFEITNTNNNDPELDSSSFNQHRIDVIISNVEQALTNTIGNFNKFQSNTYEYRMPAISEEDWDKIANNVNVMAFLQGMVVGNYKFYNNYSIVSDSKNKEFISKEAIYVQDKLIKDEDEDQTDVSYYEDNSSKYHAPGCTEYHTEVKANSRDIIGYRLIDYEIDSYTHEYDKLSDDGTRWLDKGEKPSVVYNFYLQPGTGAYECLVSRNITTWSFDELMTGVEDETRENEFGDRGEMSLDIRKAYISALAREKGAGFKSLDILQKSPTIVNESDYNP